MESWPSATLRTSLSGCVGSEKSAVRSGPMTGEKYFFTFIGRVSADGRVGLGCTVVRVTGGRAV